MAECAAYNATIANSLASAGPPVARSFASKPTRVRLVARSVRFEAGVNGGARKQGVAIANQVTSG